MENLGTACAQASRSGWLWEAGRYWALGRFGWVLQMQSNLHRLPPCPGEPWLEAELPFFRAAPLNELAVPESTSSS